MDFGFKSHGRTLCLCENSFRNANKFVLMYKFIIYYLARPGSLLNVSSRHNLLMKYHVI